MTEELPEIKDPVTEIQLLLSQFNVAKTGSDELDRQFEEALDLEPNSGRWSQTLEPKPEDELITIMHTPLAAMLGRLLSAKKGAI